MRIGIIGSGNMGRTLGLVWTELGHEVFFGSRDTTSSTAAAALARKNARHGTNDEAAAFGEVLFWTVRDVAPAEMLRSPSSVDGKVVIDPNNGPLLNDYSLWPAPGALSLAEKLAAQLPKARVVKAFNTMAQEVFELAPAPLNEHSVSAFLAGDDEAAKETVAELARAMGFVPVDAGPLKAARMLEGLADFVRYMLVSRGLGVYATFSLDKLPPAAQPRLGGRTPTRLG
jgi:8-hydroxy-5-deazaflavin:NADPH oxidoreductase